MLLLKIMRIHFMSIHCFCALQFLTLIFADLVYGYFWKHLLYPFRCVIHESKHETSEGLMPEPRCA